MRSLFFTLFLASSLFLGSVHAQPAPGEPSGSSAEPSQPEQPAQPEPVVATIAVVAPPAPPCEVAQLESRLAGAYGAHLELADGWVVLESEREVRTTKAERWLIPMLSAVQVAAGVLWATTPDISTASRVIGGATAAVTLGLNLPAMLAKTHRKRIMWTMLGATAFSLGAGGAIATAELGGDNRHAAVMGGVAAAVQGLGMLPLAFLPGLPEREDYDAYRRLPAEQRGDAAARLLTRIDRFEQRAAGITLLSSILSAAVLGLGALTSDSRSDARTLGSLTLIPLAAALFVAPRLFVRNRGDRLLNGEPPTRLPFNGW